MTERRGRQRVDLLASEIRELLAYNRNVFDRSVEEALPLPAEPHVEAWERYAREAAEAGALAALRRKLVQLRFPIQEGISETDAYRAATLRGHRRKRWTRLPGWISRTPTSCGSASIGAPRARYRSLPQAVGRTSLLWCAPCR